MVAQGLLPELVPVSADKSHALDRHVFFRRDQANHVNAHFILDVAGKFQGRHGSWQFSLAADGDPVFIKREGLDAFQAQFLRLPVA